MINILASLLLVNCAFALPNALTPSGRANVELVAKNLESWISGMEGITAKDGLDPYRSVLANIRLKLGNGTIQGVPGLTGGGKYFRGEGDPNTGIDTGNEKPTGAFCDDISWVKDGNNWVRCPEGTIIIDEEVLDPTPGTGINEGEQAGWEKKWRLVHVLVHEKWHERVVRAQIEELEKRPWFPPLPPVEKEKRRKRAKREGLGDNHHGEVYKAAKLVLQGYRELLERELRRTPKTDTAKREDLKRKLDWLKAEHRLLERSMANATHEVGMRISKCGWPAGLANTTVAFYVTRPDGYWRMDVDLEGSEVAAVRLPMTMDWGNVYEEEPVPTVPSTYIELPQVVFTGLTVQEDTCGYLNEQLKNGRIKLYAERIPMPIFIKKLPRKINLNLHLNLERIPN